MSEKPVKSLREYFQQHPERHSSCSVSRQGTEKMDISSGQVRSPGEVQGVDLSTWNPAEAPVAGVDIWSPNNYVESFEWNITQFLHRWLDLPKNLSSITLYGTPISCNCPLPSWLRSLRSQEPGRCCCIEIPLTTESPLQVSQSERERSGRHRRLLNGQKQGWGIIFW